MAQSRYTVVLYTAIILAAGATYGVYRVLESTKASSRIETRSVVIALNDMPEGSAISRDAIGTAAWPVATIPAGAFGHADSVAGRVTRVSIFKGEPIVPGRLAPEGVGPGLEIKISPGKRAMAVRINDVAGISGLIQPNSRVDVLVSLRQEGTSRASQVAKLFMENMRVLSVGTQVQRGADGRAIAATTATLEVTPEEAERLAVAVNQGTIQLVLRGYGDPDSVSTRGATSRDVLSQLREEVPEPPRPAAPVRQVRRDPPPRTEPAPAPVMMAPRRPDSTTVEVYRGGKVSEQKFERDSIAGNSRP